MEAIGVAIRVLFPRILQACGVDLNLASWITVDVRLSLYPNHRLATASAVAMFAYAKQGSIALFEKL